MNMANKLTITRVFLIPPVMALMFQMPARLPFANSWNLFQPRMGMSLALFLFILAAMTDYYDGLLARRNGWVSNFGKFLDPIADKLLILSVLIAFTGKGYISSVIPIMTLARDLAVTGLRLLAAERGQVIAASGGGKVKTAVQMISVICAFVFAIFYPDFMSGGHYSPAFFCLYTTLLWISLALSLHSGWTYLRGYRDLLKS